MHAYLEDLEGVALADCGDPSSLGVSPFLRSCGPGTVCVRFIDEFGHTVFNRGQCRVLAQEWRLLLEKAPPEHQAWLGSVHLLIQRCADEPHTFVRFIGD